MISLKIETLLEGNVVEHNRVEYKSGWNPSPIIHTICAFANDYCNVNGGYIVLGIEAEKGIPVLPPKGLDKDKLDEIQQEIFEYCNQIEPRYIPQIEIVEFPDNGASLVYMKCSPGDAGPYRAPKDIYSGKKKGADRTMQYWIRPSSLTTTAKQDEISELFEKFNAVSFDDRINRKATIDCIKRAYVDEFLHDTNSSLADGSESRMLSDLLVSLESANETDTEVAIRNIGILMFSERPEKFIPGAQIDLVKFDTEEAEASDSFIEKHFYGPIWKQVKDAMDYISVNVIQDRVIKISTQMESIRMSNYPYAAVEEALVNAVFHKSYREPEPVEIRIYMDKIQIINYPGPDRWIDMEKFQSGKIRARKYRNRRIGEFFKELDLSEKQSTGISKILKELSQNGSPFPEFETDDDRNYLIVTIKSPVNFSQNDRSLTEVLTEDLSEKDFKRLKPLIDYLEINRSITPKDAERLLGKSSSTAYRYLQILVDAEVVIANGSTSNLEYIRCK